MLRLAKYNFIIFLIILLIPTLSVQQKAIKNINGNANINVELIQQNIKKYELNIDTNLRKNSNLNSNDYDLLLKNTALNGLGKTFEQAERLYNINGLYLIGLVCLESAYGTSNFAVYRNNLVGWNAIDSNPNLATYFNSKEECILFVANKLNINYLSENGCYFEGYTAKDIDKHYCTDKLHADKIVSIVNKLIKESGVLNI